MGACAKCGYEKNAVEDLACGMCHESLAPKKPRATPPAAKPATAPSTSAPAGDDEWLKKLLRYGGPGKALRVMGGALAVGVPAMLLVAWAHHTFPDSRKLLKYAALPLALAFVVFYIGALQLVFGERVTRFTKGDEDREATGSEVLLAMVVMAPLFALIMVVVGWFAMATS